jgi:hypothetical protein
MAGLDPAIQHPTLASWMAGFRFAHHGHDGDGLLFSV